MLTNLAAAADIKGLRNIYFKELIKFYYLTTLLLLGKRLPLFTFRWVS